MGHCRSEECRERPLNHRRGSQCCACTCQPCYEADAYGVHVHVHPYAAAATTSDGWPLVAPVVQGGET